MRYLVLHTEYVVKHAIVRLRPKVIAVRGIDELCRDANSITDFADTALQHVAHTQLDADFLHVLVAALVIEGGRSRGNMQLRDARQFVQQLFRQAVTEVLVAVVSAHVDEWEHGNGVFRGVGETGALFYLYARCQHLGRDEIQRGNGYRRQCYDDPEVGRRERHILTCRGSAQSPRRYLVAPAEGNGDGKQQDGACPHVTDRIVRYSPARECQCRHLKHNPGTDYIECKHAEQTALA